MIDLETNNAFMNMAIDEAILQSRIAGNVPNTIRFYRWNPSAVSIGRFQEIEKEVYPENCKKIGVDMVRRISGGGTVYHDSESELTYSVIAKTEDLDVHDVASVYSRVYAAIDEALRLLGIAADYNEGDLKNCPNLTVNKRKISGSSQVNKGGVVLQHGTLLLNVDLPRMFTLLRVPWANSCMQVVDVAKKKITSLQDELRHPINIETVKNALLHGFKTVFNMQVNIEQLTEFELTLAKRLCEEKYSSDKWNLQGKVASD